MSHQTFCIYCQKECETMGRLVVHIERKHPGSLADENIAKPYRQDQR